MTPTPGGMPLCLKTVGPHVWDEGKDGFLLCSACGLKLAGRWGMQLHICDLERVLTADRAALAILKQALREIRATTANPIPELTDTMLSIIVKTCDTALAASELAYPDVEIGGEE